jgi:hypothetical protein
MVVSKMPRMVFAVIFAAVSSHARYAALIAVSAKSNSRSNRLLPLGISAWYQYGCAPRQKVVQVGDQGGSW